MLPFGSSAMQIQSTINECEKIGKGWKENGMAERVFGGLNQLAEFSKHRSQVSLIRQANL